MASAETIEHLGTINHIDDKLVKVVIKPESACGSCRAKGSCSIGDTDEKIIEVFRQNNDNYAIGEEIKVVLENSLGIKALGLGYILPFLILMFILVFMTSIGAGEAMAGAFALGSLVPYYTGLYLFRNNLKREFSFRLKKL